MNKRSFSITNKASVSLSSILDSQRQHQRPTPAARSTGFLSDAETPTLPQDIVAVSIKVSDKTAFDASYPTLAPEEQLVPIGDEFYSGKLSVSHLQGLLSHANVERIETKKTHSLTLDRASTDIELLTAGGSRSIPQTGKDVLVGIVDSGFDLSHPMFRDVSGNLRVVALLDQTNGNQEYNTSQLQTQWGAGGSRPGEDKDGHGTHVASIAGGSKLDQYEGIAPDAKFLLVKTDFTNVDLAVSWIYDQADGNPCVVNLSLGYHFGAHDGTSNEERLYDTLVGPGKILVVSAGNERNDSIHLNGMFVPNQLEEVVFDILPRNSAGVPPFVATTFWYPDNDDYELDLITPSGQALPTPTLGNTDSYSAGNLSIEISRTAYTISDLTQIQISISFSNFSIPPGSLQNWRFRIRCVSATTGRFDAWFHNSGFARFRSHPLVQAQGTIGIAATARGCIAVASHVSKNSWDSDDGPQQDLMAVMGRSSSFSSLGPTRDGRLKPEISAPGQYITAALAENSDLSDVSVRADETNSLLTIEGTSMSAPVVTGAIALMLQKNPSLTPEQVKEILKESAKKDAHTQDTAWTPAYGYGKLDIAAAVSRV
ncbi:S8 family peptidase [Acaryochloris marina]|uniref:S8 family peptidase n=1 Tax=Acaryochloris marina TaxID=155978 RepID=UPI0002EC571A|nr:S8 family peptidase [Acaryochloris marina]BDM81477.1 hypothetical protein AM10699_43440 [Acaryochloris marina MBIC10699]